MTVSHVINEHPHVKDSTRRKVLRAIDALDYRVNVAARNLRTGRTGTIGLAVPEVDRPYYGQLAAAIIEAASAKNLRVVIEQTGASRENELDALALSRNRLYDGLILSTVGLGPADTELLKVEYPVVILGERIFEGPVDHVAMANVEGAQAATEHLIERGCRRIAMIDGNLGAEVDVSTLRHQGYLRALEAAGIEYDPSLIVTIDRFTMRSGADAVHQLVERNVEFDGVFALTDSIGIGVLRGLSEVGIPVPQAVKVIAFDNVSEGEFLVPSLSTIDPDHALMASRAVDLLARRISNPNAAYAPEEFVSTYRVIERESSAVTPA